MRATRFALSKGMLSHVLRLRKNSRLCCVVVVHGLLDGFTLTKAESAVGDIVTSLIQKSFSKL